MKDQKKTNVEARGFQVNIEQRGTNEQRESKECETKRQEAKYLCNWSRRFMKLLEIKVHCHEIEVYNMSSCSRRPKN